MCNTSIDFGSGNKKLRLFLVQFKNKFRTWYIRYVRTQNKLYFGFSNVHLLMLQHKQ